MPPRAIGKMPVPSAAVVDAVVHERRKVIGAHKPQRVARRILVRNRKAVGNGNRGYLRCYIVVKVETVPPGRSRLAMYRRHARTVLLLAVPCPDGMRAVVERLARDLRCGQVRDDLRVQPRNGIQQRNVARRRTGVRNCRRAEPELRP